ncbi:cytochrome P450 [Podospora appendiculata]|uniref:Cytochrome P450 n=1 Tax=Podospora appendiculata TaxID=314037 RepID=A0AAE1CAR0_9PEZI|nr:cytochrome P450 [Podospora appendiculata]
MLFGLGFCALLATWYYLNGFAPLDCKEPPAAKTSLPIIGHFLGFYRHQIGYLELLRRRTFSSAYTLKVGNIKTYVVTEPGLSHAALQSRALSLEPLSATVATKMLGMSKTANRHFGIDEHGHFIGSPMLTERRLEFSKMLASGPSLTEPSQVASNCVANAVNNVGTGLGKHDLFGWLRDVITVGTIGGLYGPMNPVALDPTLVEDIWTFDENQLRLSWEILQSLIAPAGVRAVNRIAAAFEAYVLEGRDKLASAAVRSTISSAQKLGLSLNDYARLEVFNISVATVNTVPTAVSMIYNILAKPALPQALRDEIQAVLTHVNTGSPDPSGSSKTKKKKRKMQLDISRAAETCPLLVACYQEALRIGSTPTCNRAVLEDTLLADAATGADVLVRKGQRVSIPTFMLHSRDQIWGGDATAFDPWRFMPGGSADAKGPGRARREQGFVPYGGGLHLCPGRHLAKIEILATGALMVMGLDFLAGEDGKAIVAPTYSEATGAKKPEGETRIVRIRRREGWEDVEWSVKV